MSSSPLRQLRADDAEAVAALFVEVFGEARPVDAEEIRSWIANTELKPENLRVLEQDGRIVGYGDIWVEEDEVALDVAAPGHWEPFLDWAEETARALGVRTRAYFEAGHELGRIVEGRGYRNWRSSFVMETDLLGPPPVELPDGFALTTYADEHHDALLATLNEAFAGDPFFHTIGEANFREFYLKARGFDPALWLLAWDGDELAGFVQAYGAHGSDEELGWIGSLGVRAPWRRRGLGEALLRAAFHALHERGFRRAGLGVDAENPTGALRLYERAGMHQVVRNDNWVLDP
jgi:mycothiol synthase